MYYVLVRITHITSLLVTSSFYLYLYPSLYPYKSMCSHF